MAKHRINDSFRKVLNQSSVLMLAGLLVLGANRVEGVEAKNTEARSSAKNARKWEVDLTAYGWIPSIRGSSATIAGDTKITMKEVLEDLQMEVMLAGEIRKGKWLVYGDMVYLDLKDDIRVIPLLDADLELKAFVSEIGGGYRIVDNDGFSLAVIAGARYLYIDVTADVLFVDLDESQNAWNGIVGFDVQYQLPGKWHLYGHLDAGTGDTKFTWQALGSLGYHFDQWDAFVGYRHVVWDFDEDDDFGKVYKDLTVSGPYVGVKYLF